MGFAALSCGRWRNDTNRLQLACGPDVDPAQNSYIQVTDIPHAGFDAVLLQDDQISALKRSAYGCLEVPHNTQRPAEVIIRDQASINGRVLSLREEWTNPLLEMKLSAEPALSDRLVKFLCPADSYITAQRFPMTRIEQPTRVLTRTLIHAEIYNDQNEQLQQLPLTETTGSINLDPSWPEGRYQLKLISRDVFERNAPPFESRCQIVVDRTPPVISSSLELQPYYDETRQIRRLAPGAQVTFNALDASGAETFVCLSMHPAICNDEDYIPLRAITAPAEGLWDLKAYAMDKAGHRSELLEASIAVYHQEQVDQLLARLSNVQLNLLLGAQAPALQSMREASSIRHLLKLEGEQTAIQWAYIENFWKLDQKLNLLQNIDFNQPVQRVNVSPVSDTFLVQGDEGPAVLFDKNQPVSHIDRNTRADFSPSGVLWTAGNRFLKLYENNGLIKTFSTEISSPKLKSGQTKDRVAIWGNKGTESLVRVYDRASVDDSPIFKANFPRTHAVEEHYSFFASDRYVIGHNNQELMIWDTQQNFAQQIFQAPAGCVVVDYAVRMDRKIYMLSHKAISPGGSNGLPSESFCELKVIDFEAPGLSEILTERLNDVIHPKTLALTADPEQSYLALATAVTSKLHLLDLVEPRAFALPLKEFEVIHNVAPISNEKPLLFIGSTRGVRLLQMSYSNDIEASVYFSGEQLGTCLPHASLQRFICFNFGQRTIQIYSSERDRTLQPLLYYGNTRFEDRSSQHLTASTLKSDVHAVFDFETRRLQLQDEGKIVRASVILPADATALSLQDDGRLAVGMENGAVGVIDAGREPVLFSEIDGTVLDIHLTTKHGIFVLRQKSNETQALENFTFNGRELKLKSELLLSNAQPFNKIIYSEDAGQGVLYFKGSGSEAQEALIFTAAGAEQQRIPMTVCSLVISPKQQGFYFTRDEAILFHDFQTGSDQLIADSLDYTPCSILEGLELYATGSGSLYSVRSGQAVASGSTFGLGPRGTVLVSMHNSLKVLSSDGQKTLVELPLQGNVEVVRIHSALDHPEILLEFNENSLGQGIRRLTTDLDTIDQLLTRWGR